MKSAEEILSALVAARSDQAAGSTISQVLAATMEELALSPQVDEHGNVSASMGEGSTLCFIAHTETAGFEGQHWTANPLGEKRDDAFFGRGAADAKGSITAMLLAAARLKEENVPGLALAFSARGEQPLLKADAHTLLPFLRNIQCEFAISGEPTGLKVTVRQQGCMTLSVTTATTVRHERTGWAWTNPIENMLAFCRLTMERRLPSHSELGRGSYTTIHVVAGGHDDPLPQRCKATVYRFTIPNEDETALRREIQNLFGVLQERDPYFEATVEFPHEPIPPMLEYEDDRHVKALLSACREVTGKGEATRGSEPGLHGWLAERGVNVVCFGPGDSSTAHAADEKVKLPEVEQAAEILYRFAKGVLSGEPA
jgi:acetylornithine deacetylase/succinyl-diaminopimelate desuccinylase-like protein